MSKTKKATYAGTAGKLSCKTVKHELPTSDYFRKTVAGFALELTKRKQKRKEQK